MANNRLHKYDAGAHARKLREKAENKKIKPIINQPDAPVAAPVIPAEPPKEDLYRRMLRRIDESNKS